MAASIRSVSTPRNGLMALRLALAQEGRVRIARNPGTLKRVRTGGSWGWNLAAWDIVIVSSCPCYPKSRTAEIASLFGRVMASNMDSVWHQDLARAELATQSTFFDSCPRRTTPEMEHWNRSTSVFVTVTDWAPLIQQRRTT